jgi:hypothetical protein
MIVSWGGGSFLLAFRGYKITFIESLYVHVMDNVLLSTSHTSRFFIFLFLVELFSKIKQCNSLLDLSAAPSMSAFDEFGGLQSTKNDRDLAFVTMVVGRAESNGTEQQSLENSDGRVQMYVYVACLIEVLASETVRPLGFVTS